MEKINKNEAKVIVTTSSGGACYKNSSSAADIQEAKALRDRLCKLIKTYASTNKNGNPTSVSFRYKIGELLFKTLYSEGVTNAIRKEFLTEIEQLTDIDALMGRPLGKAGSDQRHPYLLTCLWLYSSFDEKTVYSLNWSDWSEIYARPRIRDDSRIPSWISNNRQRLDRNAIREVLKAITYLVEENDLSFMDDEDIFLEMEKAFVYEETWRACFEKYFDSNEKNMSGARQKKPAKYKEKYIREVMKTAMFSELPSVSEKCEQAFKLIYVDVQ